MKIQFLPECASSMLFAEAGTGIAFVFGVKRETAGEKQCCCDEQGR
jgi:hypothetical protein